MLVSGEAGGAGKPAGSAAKQRQEKCRRPDGGVRAGDKGSRPVRVRTKSVARRRVLRLQRGRSTRSAGRRASFRQSSHPGFWSGWEHASQRFPFQIRGLSTQFPRPNGHRHSRVDDCGASARAQTVTVVTPHAIVSGLDLAGAPRSGRGVARLGQCLGLKLRRNDARNAGFLANRVRFAPETVLLNVNVLAYAQRWPRPEHQLRTVPNSTHRRSNA